MKIKNIKPKIRHLAEMKEVLFDQEWAETASDLELYYMYRDLAENKTDREEIIKNGLRYDITVLNPLMLGKEYNKTAGHDHPVAPQADLTYPEIYEVLEGEAIFLLQDSEEDRIKDIYAVKARKNDKVVVLPNYEHLIINASGKELKTANWVCRNFASNIYKPFRNKHGFGYFALKGNSGDINWIKNENYTNIPSLRFLEPNLLLDQLGLAKEKELYSLVKNLTKLDFLKRPDKYDWSN